MTRDLVASGAADLVVVGSGIVGLGDRPTPPFVEG